MDHNEIALQNKRLFSNQKIKSKLKPKIKIGDKNGSQWYEVRPRDKYSLAKTLNYIPFAFENLF